MRQRPVLRLGSFLLLLIPLALLPSQPAAAARIMLGQQTLVFDDHFRTPDWGSPGAVWCPYTSAYPNGRTNTGDRKRDKLTPKALSIAGGGLQFRAAPVTEKASGQWATGLITTEPWDNGACGGDGFTLQPDDYLLVHLRLPARNDGGTHGAWPGVWTWMNGGNEVDILEWHSEAPGIAEFVNHVKGDIGGQVRSSLLGYGKWVYVGARLGTDSITWYLGDSPARMKAVYSDHRGLPANWRAYLVVNLSVSGQPGRAPTKTTPMTTVVSSVQVYR